MTKTLYLMMLGSIGIFAITTVHAEQRQPPVAVAGDATVAVDGETRELLVACTYSSPGSVAITSERLDARFYDNPGAETHVAYQADDPGLNWSSIWLDSVEWERQENRFVGSAQVRNANLPSSQESEKVTLTFDIRCDAPPV